MPRLTILSPEGGEEHFFLLGTEGATIGRGASCALRLPASSVSFQHVRLIAEDDEYFAVDLGSTNGTLLNGRPLAEGVRAPLRDGDKLEIGIYTVLFARDETGKETEDPKEIARRLAREALSRTGTGMPSLSVLNGPQAGLRVSFSEGKQEILIGREEECDLCLLDAGVSRRHALVQSSLGGVEITDLGSRHGTIVDGTPISPGESARLHDRSEILIGQTRLSFTDPEEAYLAALDSEEIKSDALKASAIKEELAAQKAAQKALRKKKGRSSPPPGRLERMFLVCSGLFFLLAVGFFLAAFG